MPETVSPGAANNEVPAPPTALDCLAIIAPNAVSTAISTPKTRQSITSVFVEL